MKIEIQCDQCGKMFFRSEAILRKNKHYNFCSRECRFAYQKENKCYQHKYKLMNRKLKILANVRKTLMAGGKDYTKRRSNKSRD